MFAVSLAVRLIHIWQIRDAPFFSVLLGDARGYDEWGRRIAAGDWIGKDVFYQAPLYPYFLGASYALVGHSLLAVRIIQAVIGSASCVFLALAGTRFFSERVGVFAGVALALYAPAIFFDGLIQKSVLDVFFLCVSLWLLGMLLDRAEHRPAWFWLGAALGAFSLTRENALVLIAVIAVWGVWRLGRRSLLAPLGSFVLGLAVVLLPVVARNYAVAGGFYLTTSQFGPNLYIGNNPHATGTYVPLKEGRGAPDYEREDATELAERAAGHPLTPGEVSSYWTRQAVSYITSQPAAWLELTARKFALLGNRIEAVDTESQETYAEWSWPLKLLGWVGHFGVLMPLALFGAITAWRDRRRLAILYGLTIAYAASVLVFYVVARYRFPLVPLLLLFAAEGVVRLPAFVRAASPPARKAAVAAVLMAAIVFANWPVLSAASMASVTEINLGAELQALGRTDEAVAHYRRAIALAPDNPSAYLNLGTALRLQGRTTDAVDAYHHALALRPDDGDAHYDLANTLMDANRVEEAIREFTAAADREPQSVDIQNNLGTALARAGRNQDAAAAFARALAADPNSTTAHRNLADLHYDQGVTLLEAKKPAEAAEEFRQALLVEPGMIEAHNNLGAALAYQGKTAEAVAEFQQALKLDPSNENALQNLAAVTKTAPRP